MLLLQMIMQRSWISENSSTVAATFVKKALCSHRKCSLILAIKLVLEGQRKHSSPMLVEGYRGSDGSAGLVCL